MMKTAWMVSVACLALAACAEKADRERQTVPIAQEEPVRDGYDLWRKAEEASVQGRHQEAFEMYLKGAQTYPYMPQFAIATAKAYLFGTGVGQDKEKAYEWAGKAYAYSRTDLGMMGNQEAWYIIGKTAIEARGDFRGRGLWGKLRAALMGHERAYVELAGDLDLMYAEHIKPLDENGRTVWSDEALRYRQERGAALTDENGMRASSWQFLMVEIPQTGVLDSGKNILLPFQLSIAYQHGIGMPKNQTAAQALRLYAQKIWKTAEHSPFDPDGWNYWFLDSLSIEEQEVAERLSEKMLTAALSNRKTDTDESIGRSAAWEILQQYLAAGE